MQTYRFSAAFAVLCVGALLSSCSADSQSNLSGAEAEVAQAYRGEVAEVQAQANNAFVDEVLADGYVSDAEFREAASRFQQCLVDNGYSEIEIYADGSYALMPPAAYLDVDGSAGFAFNMDATPEGRCDSESGYGDIAMLYRDMLLNPSNEDWFELTVQCLKDKGAVEPNFTVEDYMRLNEEDSVEVQQINDSVVRECEADPLGLFPNDGGIVDVP